MTNRLNAAAIELRVLASEVRAFIAWIGMHIAYRRDRASDDVIETLFEGHAEMRAARRRCRVCRLGLGPRP